MTSKQARSREITDESESGYSLIIWWLLSFVLLNCASSPRLLSSAAMFPSGPSLASPADAWSVPISRVDLWGSSLAPAWILVALVGGIIIAFIAQHVALQDGFWMGLLAVIALSWGFYSLHLIPASLLWGIAWLADDGETEAHRLRSLLGITVLVGCALTGTLEFGFILLYSLFLFIPLLRRSIIGSRAYWYLAFPVGLLIAVLLGSLHSGFRATLFRACSWWFVEPMPGILDSLSPAISVRGITGGHALLLTLIGMIWFRAARSWSSFRRSLVCLILFSSLGILCAYYLWLSTIALVLGTHRDSTPSKHRRLHGVAIACAFLFGIFQMTGPGTAVREYLLTGTLPARRIDPTEWGLSGAVLLLDLDRSSEWHMLEDKADLPLVLDDRWEVSREHYSDYAALVRDLSEMQAILYIRTDLQFGGYLHQLRQWNPILVVAESHDLQTIRNLSLSPHWKLMGIDSQNTIFGQAENSATLPQIQKTGDLLLTLEWPNDSSDSFQQNVIAASTPAELRRVASVLMAIRLPYAALRVLPRENSVEDQKIEAWCYLELAHRTFRNTGTHSLIDNFRAMTLIQQLHDQGQWSPAEVARLSRVLNGLQIPGLAEEIFPDAGFDQNEENMHLEQLQTRDKTTSSEPDALEQDLRVQILRGQKDHALADIEKLPDELRPFYRLILSSMDRSNDDLAREFYAISEGEKMPLRLRVESLFYLGCVAIEFGDRDVAINALSQSEQLDPQSNRTPLRVMYLQNLQRP